MLQEKVLQIIKNYELIEKGEKVVVGVSGGPDSMCLLDILYGLKETLQIELFVSHINHGIRKEAEEETVYVEKYCETKRIPCFVKKIDVVNLAKQHKLGTEEMGRKVRYNFFEEVAKNVGATKIATAHTANDNAETVLMNILRGSGITGLKGIEIKRDKYIRPLIEITREEIENYCEIQNLEPKIDKSNLENIYTRNKIRNVLIPNLQKEFNPNIVQTLNRLSKLANEEEQYFIKIVKQEYETIKIGENEKEIILNLKMFNNLPKVIKSRIILYTINKVNGTTQRIEKINLEDIIKLCQNNIGNKYLMPNKNVKVFIQKGKIFISKISGNIQK